MISMLGATRVEFRWTFGTEMPLVEWRRLKGPISQTALCTIIPHCWAAKTHGPFYCTCRSDQPGPLTLEDTVLDLMQRVKCLEKEAYHDD
jgi:hypothetical protein